MLLTINSLQLPLLNCVCVSLLDYTINRLLFVCFHYLFWGLCVLFCVSLCFFLLSLCGTTKKLDLSNSVTAHAHLLSVLLTICIYFSLNSCTFSITIFVFRQSFYKRGVTYFFLQSLSTVIINFTSFAHYYSRPSSHA